MIAAVFDFLPLWLALPVLLALCALGLIVAAAVLQALVMLAEAAWHGGQRLITVLTLAFVRAGLLIFQWCGMAVLGIAQMLWWGLAVLWERTGGRVLAAVRLRIEALRQRRKLWELWRREFRQDFATFAEFLDAFERGGKQREEPRFDEGSRREERARRDDRRTPPPPDADQKAFAEACLFLGLPTSGFTREELNARFRRQMSRVHPDKGGGHERAVKLNRARDLIMQRRGWT